MVGLFDWLDLLGTGGLAYGLVLGFIMWMVCVCGVCGVGRCSALVGFFCFACLIDLLLSRCFLDLLLVFWLCMLCW